MPHLRDIRSAIRLHTESFDSVVDFPQPCSGEDVTRFVDHLDKVVLSHENVETELMSGLQGLFEDPFVEPEEVNDWMDRFFISRISIKTLITQHSAMVRQKPSIVRNCNVNGVIRNVSKAVVESAAEVYHEVPDIVLDTDREDVRS